MLLMTTMIHVYIDRDRGHDVSLKFKNLFFLLTTTKKSFNG